MAIDRSVELGRHRRHLHHRLRGSAMIGASGLSEATPAIRVQGLAHRFGAFEALTDVSFEVGRGDVYGFIGPNGAGKTTTIRSIATLHAPDRGTIEICGVDVRREPERARRALGYMPDHAGVYERLTTEEYLQFFADVQRLSKARVDRVLELAGLEAIRDRFVADLSKGQKQRVQLARILLHDPEVLILDEPASDLDPRARVELRELVLLLRREGKTILLSSHILSELEGVCTHVGILDHGRMVASGPIGEIARQLDRAPASDGIYRQASQPGKFAAKLRVIGDPERVLAVLARIPNVSDVSVSKLGRVTLSYVGDEVVLAGAVKALVHADLLVCAVEPQDSALERIFLQVTSGNGTS
jgi:ABC-2 type transport system ATP-binding protein